MSVSKTVKDSERLINKTWLRWNAIYQAEKFICIIIVFTPVWWFIGWSYFFPLLLLTIAVYEWRQSGELRLKSPSVIAVSALAFSLYRVLFSNLNSTKFSPSSIIGEMGDWLGFSLLIWYIQSRKIRARTQVIAWACSVLVVEMLLYWFVTQLVLGTPHYEPPRSLSGVLSGAPPVFNKNSGFGNYLPAYEAEEKVFGPLSRYSFFFTFAENLALVGGFTSFLGLDIKNRLWSQFLFLNGFFLIFISGTRSNLMIFPVILILRCFISIGKKFGLSLVFTIIAIVSYVSLSLPPVTNYISTTFFNTAETTGKAREESTEVRQKIYDRTWEEIRNEPDKLLLGRGVPGETVLPGFEPAKVGTHSFLLGSLLYQAGLLGSGIFVTMWLSIIFWLYQTQSSRPLCCLLIMVYMSLFFIFAELQFYSIVTCLVCVIQDKPIQRLT